MSSIAKPFGMLLMFLYSLVNNYGVALILFTIVIKVILLPFQMKGKRGMMKQTRLQPRVAEIQKKHGANKTKVNEEMAKFYKEEGVNPASGCLWSLLPMPIMLALFLVIREPITMMMGVASELLAEEPLGAILAKLQELGFQSSVQPYYVQVDQAQFISTHFDQFSALSPALRTLDFRFGLLNLGAQPQWDFLWTTDWSNSSVWLPGLALFFIPLFSAGSQFLATIINKKTNPPATNPDKPGGGMQTVMMLMPLMSVYFAFITPAALGFYWTMSTLAQIIQDVILTKRYTRILDAEDLVRNEERKIKEAELEAKRIESERKKAEGIVDNKQNVSKKKKQKSNKQVQIEKASEWEKKHAPPEEEKYEPSRVGNRRYARGRAYDPDRYSKETNEDGSKADDESEDSKGEEAPDLTSRRGDGLSGDDAAVDTEDEEIDSVDDFNEVEDGDSDESDEDDDESDDEDYDEDEENPGPPPTTRFGTKKFD